MNNLKAIMKNCKGIIYESGVTTSRHILNLEMLDKIMPVEASPAKWLCEYLNIVIVWYDYVMFPISFTKKQVEAYSKLIDDKIISKDAKPVINY